MSDQKPTHVVTGSVATVTVAGELRYLYKGAPVPVEVSEEHLEALVDLGLVSKIADVEKAIEEGGADEVVVPAGDPEDTSEWTVKVLKRWAADNGREIPAEAKKRDEILAALGVAKAEPKS